MDPERAPSLLREAFHCPAPGCGVFALQRWTDVYTGGGSFSLVPLEHYMAAACDACGEPSVWRDDVMIYPLKRHGEEPHPDMPVDVLVIFEEARSVAPLSRKSAAGLLRLALQILIDDLEPGAGTVDAKIGALVRRGLDPEVQQAMDVLRVVGNESVHPGQIDLDTETELLPALFNLANVIVEQVITRPKQIGGLFAKLPAGKREAIERRDGAVS